jgi:hypothetical protein
VRSTVPLFVSGVVDRPAARAGSSLRDASKLRSDGFESVTSLFKASLLTAQFEKLLFANTMALTSASNMGYRVCDISVTQRS